MTWIQGCIYLCLQYPSPFFLSYNGCRGVWLHFPPWATYPPYDFGHALLQVKHHIIPASNPLTPCLLIKHDHSAIRAVTLHQVHFFLFSLIVSLLQLVMVGTLVFLLLIMLRAGRAGMGRVNVHTLLPHLLPLCPHSKCFRIIPAMPDV